MNIITKFDWTFERYDEFDNLIEFMQNKNTNDLMELYGSSYLVKEQEEFYYSENDAWADIQSIIKTGMTCIEWDKQQQQLKMGV